MASTATRYYARNEWHWRPPDWDSLPLPEYASAGVYESELGASRLALS